GDDAGLDQEHPDHTPAADGDAAARPVDGEALVDVQGAVGGGEGDGLAGETAGEDDLIAAAGGGEDLAAPGAVAGGTGVGVVRNGQRAGKVAIFQHLQAGADGRSRLDRPRRAATSPERHGYSSLGKGDRSHFRAKSHWVTRSGDGAPPPGPGAGAPPAP